MRKTSLASARAHLGSIVRDVQRNRRRTLIVQDGKPIAAVVPVDVREQTAPFTPEQIDALFAGFGNAQPHESAVSQLLADRR